MIETMYGPHFAKKYINDYLMADMPHRVLTYRNAWNLDSNELPLPEAYLTYEPLALDIWPTIITVVISTRRFDRVEFTASYDPKYSVVYTMRTYIWVRTEGSENVTLMRDRLTTVLRSAMLDYPCLKRSDPSRMSRIFEESVSEEFSDLTLLKGDRVLAGAYIGYDIELEEVIAREQLGTVAEFDVDVMPIDQM